MMTCCQNRKHLNDSSICFLPPVIHLLIKSGIISFTFCTESVLKLRWCLLLFRHQHFLWCCRVRRVHREIQADYPYKDILDSVTPLGNINKELCCYLHFFKKKSYLALVHQLPRVSCSSRNHGVVKKIYINFCLLLFDFAGFNPFFLSENKHLPLGECIAYARCMLPYNNPCVLRRMLKKSIIYL